MKTILIATGILLTIGWTEFSLAQSTTGGRSGGSTASTGAGYRTPGKKPTTSEAASMTIADEGASRGYMYVPPGQRKTGLKKKKNTSGSPDGSANSTTSTPSDQATKPTDQKSVTNSMGAKDLKKPRTHQ